VDDDVLPVLRLCRVSERRQPDDAEAFDPRRSRARSERAQVLRLNGLYAVQQERE
jgi:hypothetical protein